MGRQKKVTDTAVKGVPALTPEAQENKMISLAMDLAERQLREGTASSQTINHFLQLGTTRAQLEKEKLENENALLRAKAEAYDSAKNIESLYQNAIAAMKTYGGGFQSETDEEVVQSDDDF